MVDSLKVYILRYWKRGDEVCKQCFVPGIRDQEGGGDGEVERGVWNKRLSPSLSQFPL